MRLKSYTLSFGSQIFKSLADESRVRILHLVYTEGEMCISDLELILGFTQTKTSRHITYLKNAGILKARKQDQWVFYSIKEEVQDIIKNSFAYIQKDTTLVQDQETLRIMKSNRELAIGRVHPTWQENI